MATCQICLGDLSGDASYHKRCLKSLFGTASLPKLDIAFRDVNTLASQMAGKMSLSGVQTKLSLRLSPDKKSLEFAETGGRFILKPEPAAYAELPQNEQLTMRLASLVKIETAPFGLIRLKEGQFSYIIKRFDRLDDGTKLPVEDFCQLRKAPAKEKYEGSAEICADLLKKYATEPMIEVEKLYRLLLFGWWVANGDQHLKNLSLITDVQGIKRLSPAYDLVNTRLLLPDDNLALKIGGRKKGVFPRYKWTELADAYGLPPKRAHQIIESQIRALEPALQLIRNSYLSDSNKAQYEKTIRDNTDRL